MSKVKEPLSKLIRAALRRLSKLVCTVRNKRLVELEPDDGGETDV